MIPLSSGLITNNSTVSLKAIQDSALVCHTDLITCCREIDNPDSIALGKWVGPDGNSFPSETKFEPKIEEGFYVTRNITTISLHYRGNKSVAGGAYCCIIPRAGHVTQTFCVEVQHDQGMCSLFMLLLIFVTPAIKFISHNHTLYIVSFSPPSSECSDPLVLEVLLAVSVSIVIALTVILIATLIITR